MRQRARQPHHGIERMLQDVAALATAQARARAIGQRHVHVGQRLQHGKTLAAIGWHSNGRTRHAQARAHVDGRHACAIELGRRLHHQVGQFHERDDLVHGIQHVHGGLGLVDGGAFHAHQHVGLVQWAGTEGRIHRGATGQHHAFVELAPHGFVGVEALLHSGVGQARLVANHLAHALCQQCVDLAACAGAVGVSEVLGVGGRGLGHIVGHQVGGLRIGQALGLGACHRCDGYQGRHQGLLRFHACLLLIK